MINMFRRLTAKEWGMIALSTVFICLAVWMDLKTPEYLSDITTLLAKEGPRFLISWSREARCCSSLWKLFDGSFCGLLASRVAASFTTRLRGEIFHQVMDYSDAEIKKFSVPSLLTRTTNDLTQLQIMIVMGMQVVTRGPHYGNLGFDQDLGQERCLDNVCWDCGLDGLDSAICSGSYCLSAPAKGSRFDRCFECDDTGEFDWGAVVRAYNAEAYQNEKFQAENKGLNPSKSLCLSFDVFDEPCHDSGIKWLDPCYLLDRGALDQ